MNTEQAKTEVAALLSNLSSLDRAIQRARISNSCSETEISFKGLGAFSYDSRDECEIFNVSAGGIPNLVLSKKIYKTDTSTCLNADINFNAHFDIDKTGNADLMFQVNCIDDTICIAFNQLYGISGIPIESNPTAAPPYTPYEGSFNPSPPADSINDDTADLQGKDRFCRYQPSTNLNQINYLLLRR